MTKNQIDFYKAREEYRHNLVNEGISQGNLDLGYESLGVSKLQAAASQKQAEASMASAAAAQANAAAAQQQARTRATEVAYNYQLGLGNLGVAQQRANNDFTVNMYNAETNRMNAGTNERNAQSNALNAATNEFNATTNRMNLGINQQNADTNKMNAATNQKNATTQWVDKIWSNSIDSFEAILKGGNILAQIFN